MTYTTTIPIYQSITLADTEVKNITRDKLLSIIELGAADHVIITESGDLYAAYDYGHHRGGMSKEFVRKASELDKSVAKVLESL